MPDSPDKSPTIYIGPSVWRTFEMMSAAALQELVFHLGRMGIKFYYKPDWGDADIARSRSKVATSFLDTDAEVLFIVDSDMQFRPEDAVRLCRVAAEKKSIVGGVFVKRGGDHDPALPLPLGEDVLFHPDSQPVQVEYVSTGFAAVHRSVFEALIETGEYPILHKDTPSKFYPFYHHNPGWEDFEGHPIWMSEDWALCSNAKKLGFQCWADPGIRLAHWGVYDYRLEDMVQSTPQRKRLDPVPLLVGRHEIEPGHKAYRIKTVSPQEEGKARQTRQDEGEKQYGDGTDKPNRKARRAKSKRPVGGVG